MSAAWHTLVAWWNAVDPAVSRIVVRTLSLSGTLLLLLLAYRGATRLLDRTLARQAANARTWVHAQRARTAAQLVTNVARWVVLFVVLVIVLHEFGVDVEALLVSAGVLGLAIGFGAQTLIRDVISGFFLLFEGLLAVGDTIEVGSHTGTVETIGLRVTTLRLRTGALRVVPNGALTEFTRFGQGRVRALLEVSLPSGTDVARAAAVLQRVGAELAATFTSSIGGHEVSEGATATPEITLTLVVPLAAGARLEPDPELARRLGQAFEREHLPAPVIRRVHYVQESGTGEQTGAGVPGARGEHP